MRRGPRERPAARRLPAADRNVLTRPAVDLAGILLGGPKLGAGMADVFAEVEAERKADLGRAVDLEAGT